MSTVGKFLMVCRKKGHKCGHFDTLEEAQLAAKHNGCGFCSSALRIDYDMFIGSPPEARNPPEGGALEGERTTEPDWFGPALVEAWKKDFAAHASGCAVCKVATSPTETCADAAYWMSKLQAPAPAIPHGGDEKEGT